MVSQEEFTEMLDQLTMELPSRFFDDLNGGVLVSEEAKQHPQSRGDLYVMGEYRYSVAMGRSIVLYYGSFAQVFGMLSTAQLRIKMRQVLRHEFRHHLEGLAGERDLEIEDDIHLHQYLSDDALQDDPEAGGNPV